MEFVEPIRKKTMNEKNLVQYIYRNDCSVQQQAGRKNTEVILKQSCVALNSNIRQSGCQVKTQRFN